MSLKITEDNSSIQSAIRAAISAKSEGVESHRESDLREPDPREPDLAIRNALDIANRTGTAADRVTVLSIAARYSFSTGQAVEADRYLRAALELIPQIESESEQVSALLAIADLYAKYGEQEAVLIPLAAAEQLAETTIEPLLRAQLWMAIATRYADLLQPAQAGTALTMAQQSIEAAELSESQAIALAQLAIQSADLGQTDAVAGLVAQSQEILTALAEDRSIANDANESEVASSGLTPRPWSGSFGLQSSVFSGDRTRGVVTLSGTAERQWRQHFLDLSLRLTYNFDGARDDADLFSGEWVADSLHYGSEDVQFFVNSSVASDNLENLNLRARLAAGASFTIWQVASDRRLDLQTGLSARYENFEDQDDEFTPVSASLGLNYQDIWFSTLRFKQSFTFDVPIAESNNILFQSQTDLGIPISDRWSFNNSARLTLSGNPGNDNPPLLFNLQTGLQYAF
ncbi:MAG: DUF481 domain-containing protein [Elainellaceae cyanobacterium]